MWSTARQVAAGDLVIVWLVSPPRSSYPGNFLSSCTQTRDMVQSLVVTPGKEFNSRYGDYRHSDLLGIPYGSKVGSRTGKGFVHILRPTPELWTLALPHRTQILYLADIAFITSWLHIRPGSTVIEAGTGSGSFTHSIARSVGATGRVFSYEFHETRASKAAEEFARHGMSDIVTLTHRNVCKNGFTVLDTADSVFLDLPAPWEAIEHAKVALRKDRTARICCFSPCIEQVLRTVSALNDAGFTDITMYETLLRPHEVNQGPRLVPISAVADKLKLAERGREDKRQRQIAASRARYVEKRKRGDSANADAGADADADTLEAKKLKTAGDDHAQAQVAASEAPDVAMGEALEDGTPAADDAVPAMQILSRVSKEVRGHTSFLTFACLLPALAPPAPKGETSASSA
ncbi:tRNA methyltransferase complex GCD14 subunit-domain-containing protein [Gloeopeniophorella convolvens]|nr:tRNA methyltransferase complex GCD14 subunit-domain-containing protein [Gloeopeniophorella convolvens]